MSIFLPRRQNALNDFISVERVVCAPYAQQPNAPTCRDDDDCSVSGGYS